MAAPDSATSSILRTRRAFLFGGIAQRLASSTDADPVPIPLSPPMEDPVLLGEENDAEEDHGVEGSGNDCFAFIGEATAVTGLGVGVMGMSRADEGTGLWGVATQPTGSNQGVLARSHSSAGTGSLRPCVCTERAGHRGRCTRRLSRRHRGPRAQWAHRPARHRTRGRGQRALLDRRDRDDPEGCGPNHRRVGPPAHECIEDPLHAPVRSRREDLLTTRREERNHRSLHDRPDGGCDSADQGRMVRVLLRKWRRG